MIIKSISQSELKLISLDFNHIYNETEFIELNRSKVESLEYLLFQDHKPRAILILGLNNSIYKSGFSSPFGSFSFVDKSIKIESIFQIIESLTNWVQEKKMNVELVLPPLCYQNNILSQVVNSLNNLNWRAKNLDLNYEFDLADFQKNGYLSNRNNNVRKNIKTAQKNGLEFIELFQSIDKKKAYEIIKLNRIQMNKPLRMTWDDLRATCQIVNSWFFGVYFRNEIIASAIVFQVTEEIVQVIYWGDDREKNLIRPMNFLAMELFDYFKNQNFKKVDIGPSTENSKPNFGLCDFKSSIGCSISLKYTFTNVLY